MIEVREYSQVYMDCLVMNDQYDLIFASLYGGESSINHILAAIENNNLHSLQCHGHEKSVIVNLPDRRRLHAKKAKLHNQTFEHFIHCFIYERDVLFKEGQCCFHVLVQKGDNEHEVLWQRVKAMTVTPMLDEWMEPIIQHLFLAEKITANRVFSTSNKTMITCYTIRLNLLALNDVVTDMLKTGKLTVSA